MNSDIADIINQNPGDPLFVDYSETLRADGRLEEALLVCLRGLSLSPNLHRGRLALARVFFELRLVPFAVREIEELARVLPNNASIQKLLQRLSLGRASSSGAVSEARSGAEVVAEADFDLDDIDKLEET